MLLKRGEEINWKISIKSRHTTALTFRSAEKFGLAKNPKQPEYNKMSVKLNYWLGNNHKICKIYCVPQLKFYRQVLGHLWNKINYDISTL